MAATTTADKSLAGWVDCARPEVLIAPRHAALTRHALRLPPQPW